MKEHDQPEPGQPAPEHRKPGPHEQLFSLAPLSFLEAVSRAARYKRKPTPKPKKKSRRKKPDA
jgi:hypothetical protein